MHRYKTAAAAKSAPQQGQQKLASSPTARLDAPSFTGSPSVTQQPPLPTKIQRELIQNGQNQAPAFRFRPGRELTPNFLSIAYARLKDGSVSNADLKRLRRNALSARNTLSDHERMFMAGVLDRDNRDAFIDSRGRRPFQFPLASITEARRNRINNLGRALPESVQQQMLALNEALTDGDIRGANAHAKELIAEANKGIVALAGPFRHIAKGLRKYIKVNGLDPVEVINAMVNAASDNGSGDRVLAGMVYAVAKQAGHLAAPQVLSGQIKVDALTPAAKKAIPEIKDNQATYVNAATPSGLKGDTLYLTTKIRIANLYDRSMIIHELNHASTDAAAPAQGEAQTVQQNIEEANAYKAQARYIYVQLADQPLAQQTKMAKTLVGSANMSLTTALVAEAKNAPRQRRPLLEIINRQFNPRLSHAQLNALFAEDNAKTQERLILAINQEYAIDDRHRSRKNGLRGESILDR